MERREAITRLQKLLGKKAAYEIKPQAPNADQREAAKALLPDLIVKREAASKALTERRDALLAADAEYQRLHAELKQARKALEAQSSLLHYFKFTVGTTGSLGAFSVFHVEAQGDSWEEVFDVLSKKKKSA